jgi:release factor glutamine methyltransferase
MNLKQAIVFAQHKFRDKNIASASLDAEVLLLETINHNKKNKKDKSWLYLNLENYILSDEEEKIFKNFIRRREKNEPIAYIINRKEFYGLDFFVDKNVLIPRVETELLVDNFLNIIKNSEKDFTILDIGTGSGCIIISLLNEIKKLKAENRIEKTFANDISPKALEIAKANTKRHGLSSQIVFLECDLERAIEKIKDYKDVIITANLPYISEKDYLKLKPNVKNFEPKIALTTKDKGLYHINRLLHIFADLSQNFDSFYILLEADPKQMNSIESLARKIIKDSKTEIIRDLRDKKRIIKIYIQQTK